jgi:hypothetical protein
VLPRPLRGPARVAGRAGGAAAGAIAPALATYTAVLLADTATPSWHEAHRDLPFVFAGSALASGAGAGLIGAGLAPGGCGPARGRAGAPAGDRRSGTASSTAPTASRRTWAC